MKKIHPLFVWWFTFSSIWGIFRYFDNTSEVFSEIVAKPLVWLGITALFFGLKLLPALLLTDLKKNFLQTKPIFTVLILPSLFIVFFFFLINFRIFHIPEFNWIFLWQVLLVNFSTAIVEEIIYRGVLYVGLLKLLKDPQAFIFVQILFVLGHLPTLIFQSSSFADALVHAYFIILMGAIHTAIFRYTKSLYASSLAHGTWNSLVNYFLLS